MSCASISWHTRIIRSHILIIGVFPRRLKHFVWISTFFHRYPLSSLYSAFAKFRQNFHKSLSWSKITLISSVKLQCLFAFFRSHYLWNGNVLPFSCHPVSQVDFLPVFSGHPISEHVSLFLKWQFPSRFFRSPCFWSVNFLQVFWSHPVSGSGDFLLVFRSPCLWSGNFLLFFVTLFFRGYFPSFFSGSPC
jgi:hypothetical protein